MKRLRSFGLALGVFLGTQVVMGMCQKAELTTNEGTLGDCRSSCVQEVYVPAVMRCKDTCDTLMCVPGEWVTTTLYYSIGTCSNDGCIDVRQRVIPNTQIREFSTGDGCSQPCGG
jgi:hypothetical protein